MIPLPRPLQAPDKGARLAVLLPEASEVLSVREPNGEPLPLDKGERTWHLDRAPPRIEINWRQRRPELAVELLVDVILTGRPPQVQEHLRFLAVPEGLKEVVLTSPDIAEDQTPLANHQPLIARGPRAWFATVKSGNLNLEYSPQFVGRSVLVPLLMPEGTTRCVTRMRVWTDPGVLPTLETVAENRSWVELPTEVVPDRDSLPALVLRNTSPNGRLRLHLPDALASPSASQGLLLLPPHHVDRALIQAAVAQGGQQTYRALRPRPCRQSDPRRGTAGRADRPRFGSVARWTDSDHRGIHQR